MMDNGDLGPAMSQWGLEKRIQALEAQRKADDRRVHLTAQLIVFLKEGFTYEAQVVRDLVQEIEQL